MSEVPRTVDVMTTLTVEWSEDPQPYDLVCPLCGCDELASTERLFGTCAGYFAEKDDGTRDVDFGGYTEVDWNSSTSVAIVCGNTACEWEVEAAPTPEGWAEAMGRLLRRDEFPYPVPSGDGCPDPRSDSV